MTAESCDVLIIGGGVIGLAIALELRRRRPTARIVLIDKEPACGAHASGRNSGVLHAGFYYSADSLKARFCRDGNAALTAYCLERKLAINRCGKLVVATSADELPALRELHRRGMANGVTVTLIDADEARRIEPHVRTVDQALWSPTTSSVDPRAVMAALAVDAADAGISVRTGVAYLRRDGDDVVTSAGRLRPGLLVNAAGLYADRIAHDYGLAKHLRILPFKGLYLYSDAAPGALRTHIYPVPDLRFPFLGVHWTVTVDGHGKIGPTAMPAFWREQYGGLAGFRLGELIQVLSTEAGLLLHAGFDFRGLAWEEMKKYRLAYLVQQAQRLLDGVDPAQCTHWGQPGIRAQLLDTQTRTLVTDFLIERDARSLHVLNAVSPAFTCALPFASWVCDQVEG